MTIPFDFTKLPLTARKLLSGIVMLMPIYFFDIYLYHKPFYHSNPFWLSIVAAYFFAFVSLIVTFFVFAVRIIASEKKETKMVDFYNQSLMGAAIIAITMNVVLYYVEVKNIKEFILNYSAGHVSVFIALYILGSYEKRKNKKLKSEDPNQTKLDVKD